MRRTAGRHPNRFVTLLPPLTERRDSLSPERDQTAPRRDSEMSSPSSLFSGTTFWTEASDDDSRPENAPLVHTLFEELSQTWQFVVADPVSRRAVIVDPQLDNAPSATNISTIAADRVLSVVRQNQYVVDRILHTHESKDHPSSAWYLRAQLLQSTGYAPKVTIGKNMAAVQRMYKRKYSFRAADGPWSSEYEDGRFADGQSFAIGTLKATALHFPGGTYAFVVGQHIFAGVSQTELELRARNHMLIGHLRSFRIYTSNDAPPERKAQLMPVYERERLIGKRGKKLVIRYTAEGGLQDLEELH
ncbi:hypothetical protein BST61_g5843 [Cercospora zeina]